MKIAYVTMQFPVPSETFASLDVESLREQGQVLSVYCMRPRHSQFEKLMAERGHKDLFVKHFSLRSFFTALFFSLRHPVMSFSLIWWVLLCCRNNPKHLIKSFILVPSAVSIFNSLFKEKHDVVHLFWGHYPSMVGYLVKKYMPDTVVSLFLGAHDLVSAYPGSVRLSLDTDVNFTHSKSNLPMITEMGIDSSKFNVVVRGTKLDFSVQRATNKFAHLNEPVFLTAGRLIQDKGFDDVLEIFQTALSNYPRSILYIAGDGPFRNDLMDMARSLGIENSVIFLGHIKQAELIEIMAQSHFFLFMSRYLSERLPNVVKEAMYQECVVVTTKTDGIDELIENNQEGFIVMKGGVDSALTCIDKCLLDRNFANSVAVSARLKIKTMFDVNMSVSAYINYWKNAKARKELM